MINKSPPENSSASKQIWSAFFRHEDFKIKQILESEGNKETEDDKFNRVDILVENRKDELVIVEIQNTREADYFQRMLYGTAKVIDPLMQARFAKGLIFARMAGSKMRRNPRCNQLMGGKKDYEIAVAENGGTGLETGSFR